MKKRFFAKFSLFLVLVLILTSCAGDGPVLLDFLGGNMSSDTDFGGMEFRILSHADAGEGLDFVAEGESPSTRKDSFIARLAEIEKTYNCDIICDGDEDRNYATYYISGIPKADLYQSRFKIAFSMVMKNYFVPLNEIPYVDISSGKYGTESFLEAITWNGDTIGFWPVHWGYIYMGFSDAMFYNPQIFKEIGHANPNELYEQGEWNWEALQSISDACQEISTGTNPKYLTALNSYFPRMLIRSNGGNFITRDDNGKYSYALNSPEVIEAMQFARDLLNEGAINPNGSDHVIVTEDFGDGKYAVMCEYSGYYDTYIMIMNEGVGVCYPPVGPKNPETVTTGLMSIENSVWYVTREKIDSLDSVGRFLEIFCEPVDGDTEYWKEEYTEFNFLDETSGQVFLSKMLNKDFDNVVFAYDSGILFDMIEDAVKKGTITESIQQYIPTVNGLLDESVNSWIK